MIPLQPLPPDQRISWLDGTIECRQDFHSFESGQSYKVQTWQEYVTRTMLVTNIESEINMVERRGKEIVVGVLDHQGAEHRFIVPAECHQRYFESDPALRLCVHLMADLLDHFTIPEVLDRATLFPADFQSHLDHLDKIQQWINH